MKKLIVAGVMALGFFTASAQTKIGYISTDELIGNMPEAAKADEKLKEFQAALAQQGQDMMKELSTKDSMFVKDSAKLSASIKEIKKSELFALYQKVQSWQQQGQELYQGEAQRLLTPLKDKALEAIRQVAKENNYAYILDINAVIVAPPGDDVLPLVKKKLGIKDEAPKANPPATPKKN